MVKLKRATENFKQSPVTTHIVEKKASLIGKDVSVKGEIFADEELIIEGKVEGTIKINHRILVGRSGVVNADVEAREVVITGKVTGNVTASEKVELVAPGVLIGNIVCQRVALAEGVVFKGNIDMSLKNGMVEHEGELVAINDKKGASKELIIDKK